MRLHPLRNDRAYFLGLLDSLLEDLDFRILHLGDAAPCEIREDDAPLKVDEHARLKIMLRGSQQHTLSKHGQRNDFALRPGDALYWSPRAWSLPRYDRPCLFFGIVYRKGFVRFLLADLAGQGRLPGPTPHYYHSAEPIGGAGAQTVEALNALCTGAHDAEAARHLFLALLRLSREHLAQDRPVSGHGKARYTLGRVIEYLHQNYAHPGLSREGAAVELDLHPNYLSALCRETGGRPFQEMLETIRLEHARHLLRTTDWDLGRIAQSSGYASTGYFIRVFRRAFKTTPGKFRYA